MQEHLLGLSLYLSPIGNLEDAPSYMQGIEGPKSLISLGPHFAYLEVGFRPTALRSALPMIGRPFSSSPSSGPKRRSHSSSWRSSEALVAII